MNFDIIAYPLGQFLYFIYNTLAFHNYGLAIIIFTVIMKLVLLPLTIKQYRSTAKMQEIQPQIQEIQKRYKNDKEKLNQELMKVYQENKVNPAGGCLPLLIQLPILFSLYWVVMQPLKFMLSIPEKIIYGTVNESKVVVENGLMQIFNIKERFGAEIQIINNFIPEKAESLLSPDIIEKIKDIGRGLYFLGVNLSDKATYNTSLLFGPEAARYLPLLLFPIIGVITTYISSKLSMPQAQKGSNQGTASSMSNSMLYIGPIMTLMFSFQFPAGVILYWIAGYVFQIFQQLYLNKHVIKKKEGATK
jgi:YidC/Oxa1 family membrane protein insertase